MVGAGACQRMSLAGWVGFKKGGERDELTPGKGPRKPNFVPLRVPPEYDTQHLASGPLGRYVRLR